MTRDAVARSYDLLASPEQALFRCLSVFVGGFTQGAAEAVAWDPREGVELLRPALPPSRVAGTISSLVRGGLLHQTNQRGGEPRFAMPETVRAYGLERLAASGEEEACRRRHATFFLALVEALAPRRHGAGQSRWLDRVAPELANLRSAMTWALGRGEAETVLRLAALLQPLFWASRGDPGEGLRWLEAALASGAGSAPARIEALLAASGLAALRGDHRRAVALGEEALVSAQAAELTFGVARALVSLGVTAEWQGELTRAALLYEEAQTLLRRLGETYWVALLFTNLADIALAEDDIERAGELAEEALSGWREEGDRWGLALGLGTMAAVAGRRGDRVRAARFYEESLALFTALGDNRGVAGGLAGIADLARGAGRAARAARLLGAAAALGDALGVAHLVHHTQYTLVVATTRASLDAPAFAAAWESGCALSLEQAMAEAAAEMTTSADGIGEPASNGTRPRLTRREQEIVQLLARRFTNREIADSLCISPRTASDHVANLCAKLGVRSRRDVPAAAVRLGMSSSPSRP